MIRRRLLVPFVASLLVAQAAAAADTDGREKEARTACLAGDYAKGAGILSELFVATHDPAFIYNQGRCFEQNHRYDDAIARFREYLRVGKKLTRAEKADAQKHIASCQELLAQHAGSDSSAGPGDTKDAKEREAKKACLNGETATGVKLLTDLYVDSNDPTYIFNQGRCYEQGSLYGEAIERFREYLRKAKAASGAERSEAERHIADCKAELDGRKQESAAKKEGDSRIEKGPEPAIGGRAVDTPTFVQATPGAGIKPAGRGLRVAGIVVAAVGVASLATGIVLNLKHNSMIRDMHTNYDDGSYTTAGSYRTGAIVGYAAGAACVVGGAALYILGWNSGGSALSPDVSANHAGLAVTGRF